MEKGGQYREEITVSCFRNLSLGEREEVWFSEGEVEVYRQRVGVKATDVVEVDTDGDNQWSRGSCMVISLRAKNGCTVQN